MGMNRREIYSYVAKLSELAESYKAENLPGFTEMRLKQKMTSDFSLKSVHREKRSGNSGGNGRKARAEARRTIPTDEMLVRQRRR